MNREELMRQFEAITDEIINIDMNQKPEVVIEKVQAMLDKRGELIKLINQTENNNVDTEQLNRLLQKDNQIEAKLNEVRLIIQNQLSNVKNEKSLSVRKKKAHRGYLNPGHQKDGYFIDKKK